MITIESILSGPDVPQYVSSLHNIYVETLLINPASRNGKRFWYRHVIVHYTPSYSR
jgi:hypothetical protein